MIQMYDGVVNSIETVTTGAINATDTIINVLDETRIPEAPNLLVLGSGVSAETVKLIEKNGSVLTVERGLQGTAKSWASGTLVARNFTEYDHRAFKENIETLNTNQQTTNTQLPQKADKVAPSETVITSGFASGWSGLIRVGKTQEGMLFLSVGYILSPSNISSDLFTVCVLPESHRPKYPKRIKTVGLSFSGEYIQGAEVDIRIDTNGLLQVRSTGTTNVGLVQINAIHTFMMGVL